MDVINPEYLATNQARAERWHDGDINTWSLNDWLCAAGGELGEAMNAAKKLRRVEDGIANVSDDPSRHLPDVALAQRKVLEELGDTLAYLTLAMLRLGADSIDINAAISLKFNIVSERYGFPERI